MNHFDNYKIKIVYIFEFEWGGIGDFIKFFIYTLKLCMKYNIQLYYRVNNRLIEDYIRLRYDKMYIHHTDIHESRDIEENDIPNLDPNSNIYYFIKPFTFYNSLTYESITMDIQDVFYFSDEVKLNTTSILPSSIISSSILPSSIISSSILPSSIISSSILPSSITNYISIHLRLGDKYLETEQEYIMCINDIRTYNEERLFQCIEENLDKNIIFFCDNNNYKLKIKNKYNNIIVTNCNIGHTSLGNTTDKQILDAVTEFYLITNSEKVFSASFSGFSIIASKFRNIPLVYLF